MQKTAYLIVLLVSLGGLTLLDYRFKLAWFWNVRRSAKILGLGVGFFLLWDIVLILSDVARTNQAWVSGLHLLSPNLPIEEILFLTLFCYLTLLFWRWQCTRS